MNTLKQTLRSLAHARGFTAVVVLTLAIAIGANSAIFSVLSAVVLRPLPYDAPDELVMIWEANPSQGLAQEPTSAATFVDWREGSSSFASMAAYRYRGFTLTLDGVPSRIASAMVTPSVFTVLGVQPAAGRAFTAAEERPGNERLVMLSHRSWQNRFGSDPALIGATIPLDGEAYTVVGVMPEGFAFPIGDNEVEAWSPLTLSLEDLPSRPHRSYSTIGRLADGVTIERARSDMASIAARIAQDFPDSNQGWSVTLVPTEEQLLGDTSGMLWTLFGAVTLVLLIGCVNVANLLLVRSGERSRSLAVQAAFGAAPADLLRSSLMEGLVLGALGGASGLLVAWVGVRTVREMLPSSFPRLDEIGLDPSVLAFTAVVSLVAGILFSLVPAIRTMSLDVSSVLQDSSRGASLGRRSRRLADAMVAAEVGLALVLMLAAGLLLRSYNQLAQVDVGYRTENVVAVAIELPPSRYSSGALQSAFFTELMDRMRELPGVEAVGAVSYLPMSPIGTEFDMPFSVEGLDAVSPSQRPTAEYRGVISGYFEAMDIDLIDGRMFDGLDGTDGRRVALVNETVVRRYFADRNPVGQIVSMPMAGDVEIIGVVEDIRHDGVQVEANPEMFVPYIQLPLSAMHVVIHTERDPMLAVNAVRAAVREIDPQQPITRVNLIEDLISESIAPSRFSMALLLALAACAALLAVVGVYGVVRYSVSLRTKELGVRIALGADSGAAVRMVLGQAGRIVALGTVAGLIAAFAGAGVIEGLLYGIDPLDSRTFLAAASTLIAVAMTAAAIPAMRAARIDPVSALRED